MKKNILFLGLVITIISLTSCDKDPVEPSACFEYTPQEKILAGTEVTFTNCSKDAKSYEWNFGDGSEISTLKDPTHKFEKAGSFEVRLSVMNEDLDDHMFLTLTIEPNIDPKDYNAEVPEWITEYEDDFSEPRGWFVGTGDGYEFILEDGFYTFIDDNNSEDNYGRLVINQDVEMPSENYDLEVVIRNTIDNGFYGSGLIFGATANEQYNLFSYTSNYYSIGSIDVNTFDLWKDWTQAANSTFEDWNLLTIRKYLDNYYFFINGNFLYSHSYKASGNKFGFTFDKYTQVDIDAVGIYSMNFDSKKSGGKKINSNDFQYNTQTKLISASRLHSPLR